MSDGSSADPFNTVTGMLVRALNGRERLAEDLQEKVPVAIDALVESALGIWKQQDVINKKGEKVGVKVYQVAPDAKAISTLLRLANLEPADLSDTLLSMTRVRQIESDIDAHLSKAKAENLRSQTLLNDKNALAFEASFVLEEDVQGAAIAVFSAMVGFIQSIPVEVMHDEISKAQAPYQEWQMKLATIGEQAYQQFTVEKPAIESGDDEDTDEESEEDED